jgi:hypothetical protein
VSRPVVVASFKRLAVAVVKVVPSWLVDWCAALRAHRRGIMDVVATRVEVAV